MYLRPMILVTGSTGIVGTRLMYDLLMRGDSVRGLHRAGSDLGFVRRVFQFYDPQQAEQLFAKIQWAEGDVLDIGSLEDAMKGVNQVYHAAALVSYAPSDRERLLSINKEGTANVVNEALAAGVIKICHLSSVAAIGKPEYGPATEETVWRRSKQRSVYGLSKYLAEGEVWRAAAEGLPCVIVNPSVILGPSKPDQSSGMLMALFRKGPAYYPKGTAGFVDVRDVSDTCIQLMNSAVHGERFILNAAQLPFRQMLNGAAEIFGNKPPSFAVKPWMLELVWPLAALASMISGKPPRITRETARNASNDLAYDTSKIDKFRKESFISPPESLAYFKSFFD